MEIRRACCIQCSFPLCELPRRRLVPPASSSPCQSTRRNTMWVWNAIALTGLLLLHSQAASVETEHCLFHVL